VDHYFATFESRRRSKPCFGGREGKAANQLLDSVAGDLARAKAILTNAYADPFWGDKATILDIARDPSKFVTAGLPVKSNGYHRSPPQPNEPDMRDRYVPRQLGETDEQLEARRAEVKAGIRGPFDPI
jgi:hypothetical protein